MVAVDKRYRKESVVMQQWGSLHLPLMRPASTLTQVFL